MTFSRAKFLIIYSNWAVLALLMGCKRQEEPKARVAINSFSMRVNGQQWTPFQSKEDPCRSTYSGHNSLLGERPFYTINAYRDPAGRADAYSDHLLRLQVMNVTQPGSYALNGTYKEDFDSYFLFVMQQPTGKSKYYVNDPRRSSFLINMQQLIPIKGTDTKGIKGSFSGILYNEDDPSDFLLIEEGAFTFNIVNYYNQCGL